MNAEEFTIFWGDTRELLTPTERKRVSSAALESLTPEEVLLRDAKSGRLIVVAVRAPKNLYCAFCRNELVRHRYGKKCPKFAKCALEQKHKG